MELQSSIVILSDSSRTSNIQQSIIVLVDSSRVGDIDAIYYSLEV